MRNISFGLTPTQILERRKFVTRRMGWLFAKEGDILQPVRKCMGLRPGEKIQPLGGPIRIERVQLQVLNIMTHFRQYGVDEVRLEGFEGVEGWDTPELFVERFCKAHAKCTPETVITRLEFMYLD